ncbi:MAG: YidC/Oxa1 family membrane protein insertase [Candidatus Magasanikbacteria bacterium]|nr:YidC/Oxa1 family membrane protein insertase [Candidatus Magasanikbacteria bacterium]
MLEIIWNDFLYRPLFNVLIWLYNNWADQNLGWAIIYLTLLLRIVMLPLTILTERNVLKNIELEDEIKHAEKDFRNDPILQKEEIRKRIKQKKVRPWTKVLSLGIQLLVLILLYQVFLRGITGEKLIKFLYDWVDFPGSINTVFYGFHLERTHGIFWPGVVALFLLAEIYIDYRSKKMQLTKADLFYFLFFPAASFLILWILPMVKSLFILTSLIFSAIIHQFMKILFKPKTVEKIEEKK